jgi:hypothetical protein
MVGGLPLGQPFPTTNDWPTFTDRSHTINERLGTGFIWSSIKRFRWDDLVFGCPFVVTDTSRLATLTIPLVACRIDEARRFTKVP